jgi:pheromone shutdown protein TraB
VAEGVGWSPITRALTLAYRLPGRSRRLDLVVQSIDYAALGIPVIRPDLTARQLRRRWRAIPVLQRLAVWGPFPPVALAIRAFGTRRFLARHLSRDDLPTPEDHIERSVAGGLIHLIVDHRDELLIEALASIHEERCAEPVTVAVVYGAGHVAAVVRALLARYGYRPRSAEWLTVFDF